MAVGGFKLNPKIIKTYGYWEYVAVGEDFQIEQETSTDYVSI